MQGGIPLRLFREATGEAILDLALRRSGTGPWWVLGDSEFLLLALVVDDELPAPLCVARHHRT